MFVFFIIDKICIYNTIIFTEYEIANSLFMYNDVIEINKIKALNIDLFSIIANYLETFKQMDLKVLQTYLIFIIYLIYLIL
jgi:hypothetical protein